MKHLITLPNGKSCTVGTYAKAWAAIKRQPDHFFTGFNLCNEHGSIILAEMRKGMHDRINRHDPAHGAGRKWDSDWQGTIARSARQLNHPRLIIDWLPPDLKPRFSHRLRHAA